MEILQTDITIIIEITITQIINTTPKGTIIIENSKNLINNF